MGLFSKLRQVKNMAKAGGNFAFIAQNVASIYYAIGQTPFGKTLTDSERLFATGFIDAYFYIKEGTIHQDDIVECIIKASIDTVKIGYYSVCHREIEPQANSILLSFTMQLEALIFNADYSDRLDYHDIVDQVIKNKKTISDCIQKTLAEGASCSIYPAVMQNTICFMSSPEFQAVVNDFG